MGRALDRYRDLIRPGTRVRWLGVVVFALVVSGLEAVGAVLIFTLLGLATDPGSAITLPLLGDVRALLPGLEHDELVRFSAIGVAIFFIVRGVMVLAQSYFQARVANATAVHLSTDLLGRYLRLPYSFHLRRNSSQLIRNATESVNEILGSVLMPSVNLIAEATVVVGLLAVLLATAPVATLLAGATLVPLVAVVLRLTQPRVGELGRISQREGGRSIQVLQQSLHGFRDITVLGTQDHFLATYRRSRRIIARTRYLRALLNDLPRVSIEAAVVGLVAVFIVVTTDDQGAEGSLAVVGLFAYAALRIMPALNKVVTDLNKVRFGRAALDDVRRDLQLPLLPTQPRTDRLPFERELRFEGVSFTYEGVDEPTLRDIVLSIHPGSSLGIVGATGAGKSTLIDLLVGLSTPTEGRVTIDGRDLRGREPDWQANLGMVSQQVYLLDDTLRRNIALGRADEEIVEEQVEEAVALAQLEEFVASLPLGLDTHVGERGVRVSGGQRQRVAIARALYPRPSVLVLDEGTSALDNVTESQMIRAISRLREHHTIITVAHRLTTVQDHDRILLLSGGRVEAVGPYEQLLRDSAAFRELALHVDADAGEP